MQTVYDSILSYTTPQVIALLSGIGVFFLVIFAAVIRDEIRSRKSRTPRDPSEWLFTRWDEKLYDAFFREKPEIILKKLGIDTERYLKNCAVIRKSFPNLKKIAADKLTGVFLIFLAVLLAAVSGGSGLAITAVILLGGIAVYQAGIPKIGKAAAARRQQLTGELPRFLDLLQTALYINMPVSEAITVTARHLKGTLISDELLATMAEAQVGAVSWEQALEDIAAKYEVDAFSDFVLYLITGQEKGLSIYDIVARQAREVRQYTLVAAEENAGKVNTAVLIPIAIYKLIPLLFIVGFPLVLQLLGSNTIF